MSDLSNFTWPQFSLMASDGRNYDFPACLNGHWTLLYFYPKDDTPGCTKQACAYRDNYAKFKDKGVSLFGVSLDDLQSHDSFIKKFSLNFPLLADTERKLSEALGVYGKQEWKGQTYMGLSRDSFLISPKGQIVKVWRKVNPETTVTETWEELARHL